MPGQRVALPRPSFLAAQARSKRSIAQFSRFVDAAFGEMYRTTEMKRLLRRAGWEQADGFNGTTFRKLPEHKDTQARMDEVMA